MLTVFDSINRQILFFTVQ